MKNVLIGVVVIAVAVAGYFLIFANGDDPGGGGKGGAWPEVPCPFEMESAPMARDRLMQLRDRASAEAPEPQKAALVGQCDRVLNLNISEPEQPQASARVHTAWQAAGDPGNQSPNWVAAINELEQID